MSPRRFYLALIVLLLTGLSCNLPSSFLSTPTSTPDFVPSPLGEVDPPSPTDTIEPEIHPTITAEPDPAPVVETSSTSPVGFTSVSADGSTITFHDLMGTALEVVQTTGINTGPANFMHVAGGFAGNTQDLPVIFQTFENVGEIKQVLNRQITTLIPGADISNLRGAPGQYAFVYSTVTWGGEALNSYFYVRSSHGGGASWIWERVDPESWTIAPLAAEAENDEMHTVFFTLEPWGIGGDIVFPPRRGLYQLNLENSEKFLLLTEDFNPIGMSSDNTYVAYTEVNNNIGAETDARITLYSLESGLMVPIDLAPGSDRGGGYAVFSPDNQYAAWMEGAGWSMAETPSFHSRVRVANMDGVVISDISDENFANIAADPTARWAVPVGWLDAEFLLVEVRGDNWNQPALVKVRYDGSNMEYLVTGKFTGFLYP